MAGMPDNAGWMSGEPPEPDPPYDPEWVHAIHDALIHWEPRMFAEVFSLADGHDHELQAAVGMTVDYLNDQLATYKQGSAQFNDAAARADELQRLTMGDD
jgi:hypothetical protein